jgi:uncharacterized membrane protein
MTGAEGITFVGVVELLGRLMEGIGVVVIVTGALLATARFLRGASHRGGPSPRYKTFRTGVAQAILLGLEFLVAGDIIRTVAVEPTFTSVGVLAIIVLIRTFLSFEMTLEIEGRWPWQRATESAGGRVEESRSRAGRVVSRES